VILIWLCLIKKIILYEIILNFVSILTCWYYVIQTRVLLTADGIGGPTADRVQHDGLLEVRRSIHILDHVWDADSHSRQYKLADSRVVPLVGQGGGDIAAGGHHARRLLLVQLACGCGCCARPHEPLELYTVVGRVGSYPAHDTYVVFVGFDAHQLQLIAIVRANGSVCGELTTIINLYVIIRSSRTLNPPYQVRDL